MSAIDYEEAHTRIAAQCRTLPQEIIRIDHEARHHAHRLLGRVTAADIIADNDMPRTDISAMDGYAVSSRDADTPRRIIGESAAGKPFENSLPPATAVKIFTGAIVPDGADSVIIFEQADITADADGIELVSSAHPIQAQHNIRPRGLDFKTGDMCLPQGTVIDARRLTLLAAMNRAEIPVSIRPTIAIASTGDELAPIGAPAQPDRIPSSNDIALAAMLPLYGGEVRQCETLPDDVERTGAWLSQAVAAHDMVVMSGGVSVGDYDFVQTAARALPGFQQIFHGVRLKPGKPTLFGASGDCLIFGLPGNPVSAMLSALIFIVPAILKMQGHTAPFPQTCQARLLNTLPKEGKRLHLRRAVSETRDGKLYVRALSTQDSAQLKSFAESDGVIFCPADSEAIGKDALVEFMPWPSPLTKL